MEFRQYLKKDIIAWLYYNSNFDDYSYNNQNTRCYVYPRFLNLNGNYHRIDSKNDFPNSGRIEVRIQNGESAEDVYDRFKSLVYIKINREVYPNTDNNNYYSLKYNSSFTKEKNEIWIEKFSSKDFYQIIKVDDDITNLQNQNKRLIAKPYDVLRANYLLLHSKEDKLYGPFEYDIKEDQMELRALKEYQYSVGEYEFTELEDDFLEIMGETGEIECTFFPKKCFCEPNKCKEKFDWIDKNTLIDNFVDTLRTENDFTHGQIQQLKEMARCLINNGTDSNFTDFRINKIQEIISEIDEKSSVINNIVQYALKNDQLKENIIEEIIKNYFEKIEPKINEVNKVQDSIANLKIQENGLKNEILDLQSKKEQIKKKDFAAEQAELDELNLKISNLTNENEELRKQIDFQKSVESLQSEQKSLKNKVSELRAAYKSEVEANLQLEQEFNKTLSGFSEEVKRTARIIDSKVLDKILRGLGEEVIEKNFYKFDTSFLVKEYNPQNSEYIINRVKEYIEEKAHRVVEYNEVANYLICLTQGFITTFAGEPGTGKTSLCNILAKALGLTANDTQKRFVDISVERGWTSHKDFIGYYNPLTKRIEKSNNDVYDAFIQLDSECGTPESPYDSSKIAPYIILLDEANLSPIEHYWAAFLRNCDITSTSNKTFSLGGNDILHIPEHLRFLATVNFDHTTEELSPRFLDRSWIITLEPTSIGSSVEERLDDLKNIISFDALVEAFQNKDEDNIDDNINSKWNAIQKIFKECHLPIAPRNLKMVKNYCSVACKCMKQDDTQTKFAPLDYAFSQKILPTLNGTGDNYKRLIDELLKECTDEFMPISARHLERIRNVAENNMGYYQFFAR